MSDQIKEHLQAVKAALLRDAQAAGEDPKSMTKSKFVSEMERQSFISAYGQAAYDKLEN